MRFEKRASRQVAYIDIPVTWSEAHAACKQQGGSLVIDDSDEMHDWLYYTMTNTSVPWLWLGCYIALYINALYIYFTEYTNLTYGETYNLTLEPSRDCFKSVHVSNL